MRFFKRFADFCGGFAATSALAYLFCQFMLFSPLEKVSLAEKLKLFFGEGTLKDYRAYLPLVALLLLSLLAGMLLKKRPALAFAISLLPLVRALAMVCEGKLLERPMLCLLLCLIYSAGGLYQAIAADRETGTYRSARGVDLFTLVAMGVTLYIPLRIDALVKLPEEKSLDFFDALIRDYGVSAQAQGIEPDLRNLIALSLLLLATVLLSLLLKDLHFVTALFSLVPLGYTLYHWLGDGFPVHGNLIALTILLLTICRFTVMLTCPTGDAPLLSLKRK